MKGEGRREMRERERDGKEQEIEKCPRGKKREGWRKDERRVGGKERKKMWYVFPDPLPFSHTPFSSPFYPFLLRCSPHYLLPFITDVLHSWP